MTQSMELTEKVEHIRDLTALDAAEELVRLPADDIQFILSRLPASQAVAIASHLGEVAAPDSAASIAVLSGMEASIGATTGHPSIKTTTGHPSIGRSPTHLMVAL